MRLWSLHPKYLDTKGLLAVWREGLLAKKVLEGKTKGYTKHPQLIRFRSTPDPVAHINEYLSHILEEAKARGYQFDQSKLKRAGKSLGKIKVNQGQVEYEFRHLLSKLKQRTPDRYLELNSVRAIQPHPLFKVVTGEIESWEVV